MKQHKRDLLLILAAVFLFLCLLQLYIVLGMRAEIVALARTLAGSGAERADAGMRAFFVEVAVAGALGPVVILLAGLFAIRLGAWRREESDSEQRELAAAHARLRAQVDAIPDLVYFKDSEGRHLFANRATEAALGIPREELVGKTEFDLMPREAAEICRKGDLSVMEDRRTITSEERIVRPDGSPRFLETVKAPLYDASGKVVGLVGVSRDVTAHRKLEDDVRRSQKIEAVSRLAGGIAHDTNNFLGAIIGNCERLKIVRPGDEALAAQVDAIATAAYNASGLVRQLMAFGRKQPVRFERLDLNDVVDGAAKAIRTLAGPGIEVAISRGEVLPDIHGDRVRIGETLMTFVANAKEAMSGMGCLRIETARAAISADEAARAPFTPAGDYATISVSDTGRGMAPEVRDRIFEPFFTTKEHRPGAGLGLSMAYGIVKQHGGHIVVSSEPGKGSIFRVYFPCFRTDAEAPAGADRVGKAARGAGDGAKILLADDNDDVREALASLMTSMGYPVVAVASGEEVLDAYAREPGGFRLVVTDVVMPGIGGKEAAARLRERHGEVKVLFISGYTGHDLGYGGTLPAGTDFLQKPFSSAALGDKIRELLS